MFVFVAKMEKSRVSLRTRVVDTNAGGAAGVVRALLFFGEEDTSLLFPPFIVCPATNSLPVIQSHTHKHTRESASRRHVLCMFVLHEYTHEHRLPSTYREFNTNASLLAASCFLYSSLVLTPSSVSVLYWCACVYVYYRVFLSRTFFIPFSLSLSSPLLRFTIILCRPLGFVESFFQ